MTMSLAMVGLSPPAETPEDARLKPKQLQVAKMVACGWSQEDAVREVRVSIRTFWRWKQIPAFREAVKLFRQEWQDRYEGMFTELLPTVVERHRELLSNESAAIRMRAVDSAHSQFARGVRERDVREEMEELRGMVKVLADQLAQQRAG